MRTTGKADDFSSHTSPSGIRVCQIGYLPAEPKYAMLTDVPQADVTIRNIDSGAVALRCVASAPMIDEDTGDAVRLVDFSKITLPGRYVLDATGLGASDPFSIGADVFAPVWRLAMRSYYGQRCGIAVDMSPDFPEYRYDACHTGPARFDASSGRSGARTCPAGWHDAGDYGRYIVNSGITTGTLLLAYELYESRLRGISLDIPESGSAVPDMLSEIRYNIDWMLTMQDDADGGVWHKSTSANFCGFIMPHDDRMPVLIIGSGREPYKTTAATADFAAVCAMAARIYAPFDGEFARRCLDASRRAWGWLGDYPVDEGFDNPVGIKTGGYGDSDLRDERLWAAAELFRTTGDDCFNAYFLQHYREWTPPIDADAPQSWSRVTHLAMFAYVLSGRKSAGTEAVEALRAAALYAADRLCLRATTNGYRTPMRASDYVWGSNSVVANYAVMLLIADRLAPRQEYRNTAMDCVHYLLGRNTFGISFVTHAGARWPMHPHHRPSSADGVAQPWPGLLIGGPNANRQTPPARQWRDEVGRYDLNEVAINWNAPLVFALAAALPG